MTQKIDLVFRTVGERTSEAALDLAIKNIQPNQVHVIDRVKPFAKAVEYMLTLDYNCDYIVFVDADCLILEDLNPFLQRNTLAYVDCYVLDPFLGCQHCGVHITRIDVVEAMRKVKLTDADLKYVLRPESRTRKLALNEIGEGKAFRYFKIFHDFFQFHQDIFAKYVLRELRLRDSLRGNNYLDLALDLNQAYWSKQDQDWPDFRVARKAMEYARKFIPDHTPSEEQARLIANLPNIATQELKAINVSEKQPFDWQEVWELLDQVDFHYIWRVSRKTKIFVIGLSQMGNRSVAHALYLLGISVVWRPRDKTTMQELVNGNFNPSVLHNFDGIADVAAIHHHAELDQLYPGSQFILPTRDKASWLSAMEKQWTPNPEVRLDELSDNQKKWRQFNEALGKTIYTTTSFNTDQFAEFYDRYHQAVINYFQDRPDTLLVMDIYQGDSWEKLCNFLKLPIPGHENFPIVQDRD